MIQHRFINDGLVPIPMGSTAEYACVCGRRGTYAIIDRHIADSAIRDDAHVNDAAPTAPYEQLVADGEAFGGDTKAHYLPMEPREPAPSTFNESDMLTPVELPPPPPPPPPREVDDRSCETCGAGKLATDLPEISVWSCGHWIQKRPRSIAELFQDMLRSAYQAGVAATTSGESFETWYQREVLQ